MAMHFTSTSPEFPVDASLSELLVVDGAPETPAHVEILRGRYGVVNVTPDQRTARQFLQRSSSALSS